MTHRWLPVVFIAALAAAGSGCKSKENATAKGGSVGTPSASNTAAGGTLESFLKDDNAPLTPQIEEQLLLGLKDCAVNDAGIDANCEGLKTWNKSRARKATGKPMPGAASELGIKYIGNESPAIRYKAVDLMGSLLGADPATQKTIVEAAKKEQVPGVLANMIQLVGSKHKSSEEVKELLMTNTEHPSERVRSQALGWFLTAYGEGVPGTFEKVTEKLAKDPSIKVRTHLCSRLYGSRDERAIGLLEKYLTDKSTPDELYKGCWEGAIGSWTGSPRPDKPSQKGYELTLKVLDATPRTKERPPWTGMSTLRSAKADPKPDDKFGQEWLAKVKGWYNRDRLLKSLEAVAGDPAANWMARSGASEVMKELGAPKATFERLQKRYEKAAAGDDSLVKRKIDDLLKAM